MHSTNGNNTYSASKNKNINSIHNIYFHFYAAIRMKDIAYVVLCSCFPSLYIFIYSFIFYKPYFFNSCMLEYVRLLLLEQLLIVKFIAHKRISTLTVNP